MLTKDQLVGSWAGLPVAWKDDYSFDERTYRGDVARCCEAGVPGIYTGGTTGEFYATGDDEFKLIADATIQECKNGKTPVMIGCTSTYTLGAIRRAQYAAEKGADAVQVALPFWLEVPDEAAVEFFVELSAAVPGMPITIYETTRAKKALTLEQHRQIHQLVPAVIGVKSNANTVGVTEEGCAELSKFWQVFVGEGLWSQLGPHGAIGCCSAMIYLNPRLTMGMFDLLKAKKWDELSVWTEKSTRIIMEGLKPCWSVGREDSALDRLQANATGFLKTSLHCRKPYPSCTPEMVVNFRKWLADNLPEFLEL